MGQKYNLEGKKVALLVSDGFEESELLEPRKAIEEAGGTAVVVSTATDTVRAWKDKDWGTRVDVELPLARANPDDFDALVLPGGQMNPDNLRLEEQAIEFIRRFNKAKKPIAAICHGPWTLINAGAARGRTMTSWPSLRVDLENAGATWVDQDVVVDGSLITSRKPDDLPAFCQELVTAVAGEKSSAATP